MAKFPNNFFWQTVSKKAKWQPCLSVLAPEKAKQTNVCKEAIGPETSFAHL